MPKDDGGPELGEMPKKEHDYLDDCPVCGGVGLRRIGHTCVGFVGDSVPLAYIRQLEDKAAKYDAMLAEGKR